MDNNLRKLYVGIDVHSKVHRVALLPVASLQSSKNLWKRIKPLSIENNRADFERLDLAIMSHISSTKEVVIAVDHTGGHYSEPIVCFLQAKGYAVYYLESRGVRAARERLLDQESKSDVIDSIAIAYLLYLKDLHRLSFRISLTPAELGSEASSLNALVLQRWQISKTASQATNRLHQLLVAVFPEGEARYFGKLAVISSQYPTPRDILASDGLKSITKLHRKDREAILKLAATTIGVPGDTYQWIIRYLGNQRIEALAKRAMLTTILSKQVEAHPYASILLSFPYLGNVGAATIISIIRDIKRWPDKKKFKKALGVYNSFNQSGASFSIRRGKEGSKHGRRVLFQICLSCIRTNAIDNDFKDYYLRQVVRGKRRIKAVVSTMGKLAEIIYHCLKAQEPYLYQGKYKSYSSHAARSSNKTTRCNLQ